MKEKEITKDELLKKYDEWIALIEHSILNSDNNWIDVSLNYYSGYYISYYADNSGDEFIELYTEDLEEAINDLNELIKWKGIELNEEAINDLNELINEISVGINEEAINDLNELINEISVGINEEAINDLNELFNEIRSELYVPKLSNSKEIINKLNILINEISAKLKDFERDDIYLKTDYTVKDLTYIDIIYENLKNSYIKKEIALIDFRFFEEIFDKGCFDETNIDYRFTSGFNHFFNAFFVDMENEREIYLIDDLRSYKESKDVIHSTNFLNSLKNKIERYMQNVETDLTYKAERRIIEHIHNYKKTA